MAPTMQPNASTKETPEKRALVRRIVGYVFLLSLVLASAWAGRYAGMTDTSPQDPALIAAAAASAFIVAAIAWGILWAKRRKETADTSVPAYNFTATEWAAIPLKARRETAIQYAQDCEAARLDATTAKRQQARRDAKRANKTSPNSS